MTETTGLETLASVRKIPALVRGFSRRVGEEAVEHSFYVDPRAGQPATGMPLLAFDVLLRLTPQDIVVCRASRQVLLSWARDEGEIVLNALKRRLSALERQRPAFAGLPMDRPHIMGILNVTPDSFSDGGKHWDPETAIAAGLAMREAGASILDVGGESTRPGSEPVSPEEEIRRVVPVIRGLAERGALISVDTRHAPVMQAAVEAGAGIINDVSALQGDADSLAVAARCQVPVILMHMRGKPKTMQQAPVYGFAPLDVYDALAGRVGACLAAGLDRSMIAVDVGIGFAKSANHNVQILNRLGLYHGLGCAQVLAVSRKSYIGHFSQNEPPLGRIPGSLASVVMGASQGMQIVRVHDVAETAQVLAVWRAVAQADSPTA